ncbi:hypothetical protein PYCC9005_003948 [Savitreella phatthalungensis]
MAPSRASGKFASRRNPCRTLTQIFLLWLFYNTALIMLTTAANLILLGSFAAPMSLGQHHAHTHAGAGKSAEIVAGLDRASPSDGDGATDLPAAVHDAVPVDPVLAGASLGLAGTKAAAEAGSVGGMTRRRFPRALVPAKQPEMVGDSNPSAMQSATGHAAWLVDKVKSTASYAGESAERARSSVFWTLLYAPYNTNLNALVPGIRNVIVTLVTAMTAGVGGVAIVVRRSRLVWDFAGTLCAMQLALGVVFGGTFIPRSITWYLVQGAALFITAFGGQRACLWVESRPVSFTSAAGMRDMLSSVLPGETSRLGDDHHGSGDSAGEIGQDPDDIELEDVRRQLQRAMEEGRANKVDKD